MKISIFVNGFIETFDIDTSRELTKEESCELCGAMCHDVVANAHPILENRFDVDVVKLPTLNFVRGKERLSRIEGKPTGLVTEIKSFVSVCPKCSHVNVTTIDTENEVVSCFGCGTQFVGKRNETAKRQ
jgi:hypothetical protein